LIPDCQTECGNYGIYSNNTQVFSVFLGIFPISAVSCN